MTQLRLHFDHPHGPQNQVYAMRGYTLRIGRESEGVDLTLSGDPKISRYHARITFDTNRDRFLLEDEQSTHGTHLNGTRLPVNRPSVLKSGDVIRVGDTQLTVEIVDDKPTADQQTTGLIDEGLIRTRILITDGKSTLLENAPDPGKYLEMVVALQAALNRLTDLDAAFGSVLWDLHSVMPSMETGGVLLYGEQSFSLAVAVPSVAVATFSRTLALEAIENSEAIIWERNTSNPTVSLVENQTAWAIYSPLMADGISHGILFIQNQDQQKPFTPDDANFVAAIAYFMAAHLTLRRRQMMLGNLERQFSPQVASRLLANDRVALGGEAIGPVTVLMSDVRGFTRRCAAMAPQDVMETVIDMFSRLTPIVFKYGGTVDKYVGDALLAVFGCPEPDDHQHYNAICAAVEMQAVMDGHAFPIGIGIHTGEVMHGFIGSNERMEYTVIGNTVNRAARFCDTAAEGQVVISRSVLEQVADRVEVVALPPKPTKNPDTEPDVEGYLVTNVYDE